MADIIADDPAITWQIDVKDTLTGTFVPAGSNLYLLDVIFSKMPQVSTARFQLDRTKQIIPTQSSQPQIQTSIDLVNKFVRIKLTDSLASTRFFHGYIASLIDQVDADTVDSPAPTFSNGKTIYQCFGYEYFMDLQIGISVAISERLIQRVIPFNFTSGHRNGNLVGNRSSAKSSGYFQFDETDDLQIWTALDVLEYLVQALAFEAGITFTIDDTGAKQYLANIEDSWDFNGMTYRDAINTIIASNRYGMSWHVQETVIFIDSIIDFDIKDADEIVLLAANPNQISILAATDDKIKSPVIIKHLHNQHFDQIVVQGARPRVCFSMAFDQFNHSDAILERDWSDLDEEEYNDLTDKQRRNEEFEHIFNQFKLKSDWNGKSNGELVLIPIDGDTGRFIVDPDPDVAHEALFTNYQLQRSLPLETSKGQPFRPFCFIRGIDGTFIELDKPQGEADEQIPAAGLQMLDFGIGVKTIYPKITVPHFLGKGTFDSEESDTEIEPVYDYRDVVITVSMYTDERMRVVDFQDLEPGEIERIKVIDVPGAELWAVIKDTVIGLDPESGGLIRESELNYTRDDSEKLRKIASLAKAFYGKLRSKITVNWNFPNCDSNLGIGVLVSSIDSGTIDSVGTIITEQLYNFENEEITMKIQTNFFELEFNKFFSTGGAGGFVSNSDNALSDSKSGFVGHELNNTPVRFPTDTGSGGSTNSVVKTRYHVVKSIKGEIELFGDKPPSAARFPAEGALIYASQPTGLSDGYADNYNSFAIFRSLLMAQFCEESDNKFADIGKLWLRLFTVNDGNSTGFFHSVLPSSLHSKYTAFTFLSKNDETITVDVQGHVIKKDSTVITGCTEPTDGDGVTIEIDPFTSNYPSGSTGLEDLQMQQTTRIRQGGNDTGDFNGVNALKYTITDSKGTKYPLIKNNGVPIDDEILLDATDYDAAGPALGGNDDDLDVDLSLVFNEQIKLEAELLETKSKDQSDSFATAEAVLKLTLDEPLDEIDFEFKVEVQLANGNDQIFFNGNNTHEIFIELSIKDADFIFTDNQPIIALAGPNESGRLFTINIELEPFMVEFEGCATIRRIADGADTNVTDCTTAEIANNYTLEAAFDQSSYEIGEVVSYQIEMQDAAVLTQDFNGQEVEITVYKLATEVDSVNKNEPNIIENGVLLLGLLTEIDPLEISTYNVKFVVAGVIGWAEFEIVALGTLQKYSDDFENGLEISDDFEGTSLDPKWVKVGSGTLNQAGGQIELGQTNAGATSLKQTLNYSLPDGFEHVGIFSSLVLNTDTTGAREILFRLDDGGANFVEIGIRKPLGSDTQELIVRSSSEGTTVLGAEAALSGKFKIEQSGNDFLLYFDDVLEDTITDATLANSASVILFTTDVQSAGGDAQVKIDSITPRVLSALDILQTWIIPDPLKWFDLTGDGYPLIVAGKLQLIAPNGATTLTLSNRVPDIVTPNRLTSVKYIDLDITAATEELRLEISAAANYEIGRKFVSFQELFVNDGTSDVVIENVPIIFGILEQKLDNFTLSDFGGSGLFADQKSIGLDGTGIFDSRFIRSNGGFDDPISVSFVNDIISLTLQVPSVRQEKFLLDLIFEDIDDDWNISFDVVIDEVTVGAPAIVGPAVLLEATVGGTLYAVGWAHSGTSNGLGYFKGATFTEDEENFTGGTFNFEMDKSGNTITFKINGLSIGTETEAGILTSINWEILNTGGGPGTPAGFDVTITNFIVTSPTNIEYVETRVLFLHEGFLKYSISDTTDWTAAKIISQMTTSGKKSQVFDDFILEGPIGIRL